VTPDCQGSGPGFESGILHSLLNGAWKYGCVSKTSLRVGGVPAGAKKKFRIRPNPDPQHWLACTTVPDIEEVNIAQEGQGTKEMEFFKFHYGLQNSYLFRQLPP
jgi:hypothetical protein